ncbi:tetratricopeptide repeat protein [Streptomyces sp. NBC_00654]|uniref:tetratricopeptide repeat protein n=1 Tax=Streptomyces sp. NBC_00654 TaxID=2975799 RepID=UPI00224DA985|nr:tetratricopeptide repeat protein [Streptomyces sp. NBC_00654]MCX4968597.1 tetratricopeptide repeat protein [Streptomyces sp. NBC_00654]
MTTRQPNVELERLYRESGWTLQQFAQAINRIGTEHGTPLTYTKPSVHQWLQGHMPREAVRPLILEALARRLHRPVTSVEAGFPLSPDQMKEPSNPIEGLFDLDRADMDPSRRGVLGAGLFSVALTIPGWPDVVGRMDAMRTDPQRRIGQSEVRAVKAMTDRLSDLDDEFGGRYARPMAAAFLVNTVAPYLKATASSETRKSMVSAASFLCYLTGWMAVDEGAHGRAQEYYVKSLELAGASGDHMTYCHVLRGMSVQAANLGHGVPAVRLANAAAEASPESGPRMRAFMAGQQAHSYALAGEKANALSSLREAERAVNRAESQLETFGGFSSATLAYSTAEVRHALGDTKGSIESLQDHFRLRDSTDSKRSEIRFGAMLAERQLEIGHLEAACATWAVALDSYPEIHSGRIDEQVGRIPSLLFPYRSNPTARQMYERSRELCTK